MLPQPIYAILFLFPATAIRNNRKTKYNQKEDPFFIKQVEGLGNACGTVALFHALANNKDKVKWQKNGVFAKFLEKAKDLDPEARGLCMEEDSDVEEVQEEIACDLEFERGESDEPLNAVQFNEEDDVDNHFICFIEHQGFLYELDGLQNVPQKHGKISKAGMAVDAGKVIMKNYINGDGVEDGENNFVTLALAPSTSGK